MDMSLVSAALGMQAGALQTQIATRMLKMNADAAKEIVQTLLAPQANLAAGIGGAVDKSA